MAQSFAQFRDALLVALAKREEDQGPGYYDLKETAENAGLSYRPGWVRKAANQFHDDGYIREAFTLGGGEDGGLDAALTGAGLEAAELLFDEADALFGKRSEVNSAHDRYGTKTTAPASDRYVKLDHNSPKYENATKALASLIEVVLSDNEYAANEPEDREQRLAELEAGSTLLKSARVRVGAATAVLLPTIYYLADKFFGAVIGDAASATLTAIKALFGL